MTKKPLIIYGKEKTGKTELANKIAGLFDPERVCRSTQNSVILDLPKIDLIIFDAVSGLTAIKQLYERYSKYASLIFVTNREIFADEIIRREFNLYKTYKN